MRKLNTKKLGIAVGATGVILYLGCALLMIVLGQQGTISFFNALLHGFDTSSIIRMDIPLWESLLGIILTFIIGWITGAIIAATYNYSLNDSDN
ncbi:MAG: hypothetical protein CL670_00040 [Balneola sp.]|jgi:hypothetical protein|nr:hypothetical protein [Balneola sp.]MBE77524.1 hypothetical protein [Balneola sp.]|tara:strand:- start:205 stop:486 length:282 start_codon:yes stop_codon:yes gene_type:complete